MEFRRLFTFHVSRGTVLPGRNIEQAGAGAVGWWIPVRAALVAGIDQRSFLRGYDSCSGNGPAFGIEAGGPIRLHEWLALHELAGDPIDHIKHSAAVRPQHDLAGAALPIDVGEDWNLGRIPIELVMRRELVIPLE